MACHDDVFRKTQGDFQAAGGSPVFAITIRQSEGQPRQ
jgi:hypothetical protein